MAREVECASLSLHFGRQEQVDGCGGSLSGSAYYGGEDGLGDGVEPHLEVYDIRGNYTRVGTVDGDALVLQFTCQFESEKSDGELGVAIWEDTPEESPASCIEERREIYSSPHISE